MNGEYVSTFEDYKAAQKLYLKHRPSALARYRMWMYGLPILTLLSALATWHESTLERSDGFGLAAWITFCAAVGTISIVILRPWNLRRCYRKAIKLSGLDTNTPTVFSFDDSAVVSSIKGRSEGRFFWDAIQDFAEDSAITLLFISEKRFLYIPKRALDEEQWESLRQLVRAKGLV